MNISDFYYFVISGIIIMAIPIAVVAWFQAGFFLKWLKARAGRGKYILIKQRGKIRDHFETGVIHDDFLIYGKKHRRKRVVLDKKSIYTCWGVPVVDMDDSTYNIATVDYDVLPGHDPEKSENLYIRALFRPAIEQGVNKILLILLIVIIIGLAVLGFLIYGVSNQVASIGGGAVTSII